MNMLPSCFSIATIGGSRKRNNNLQIKKKQQPNITRTTWHTQPCEKEHPTMLQLNIPQGNLLNFFYYKYIFSNDVLLGQHWGNYFQMREPRVSRGPSGSRLRQPKCHFLVNTNSTPNPGSYKLIIPILVSNNIHSYPFKNTVKL